MFYVSPKVMCPEPDTQGDSVRSWGLWEVMWSGGWQPPEDALERPRPPLLEDRRTSQTQTRALACPRPEPGSQPTASLQAEK